MSLHRLGLCGCDDSVDPSLLSAIASRWPRAEFGVLFRPGREGEPRYPTRAWLETFALAGSKTSPPMQLAGHLCGSAVDAVLKNGDVSFVRDTLVPYGFRRVQLNATATNGCETARDAEAMAAAAATVRAACDAVPEVEWIVQANDETKPLWETLLDEGDVPANLSMLWDASCGKGVEIDATRVGDARATGVPAGYAGGLNRENIKEVLAALRSGVAKGRSIWMDMETGLRSIIDDEERFDVNKAWAVCAAVDDARWDDPDGGVADVVLKDVPKNARMSGHAVLAHKVTLLRDRRTKPREFRDILGELTHYVGYEATTHLDCVPRHDCVTPLGVHVPAGDGAATRLAARVCLIPIMRAGLGMVDAMLNVLPNAAVFQIGMFKRQGSDRPIEYYSRLPVSGGSECDVAFILDPVIATSRTMQPVVSKLKAWGARRIVVVSVLASAAGLDALHAAHPDVDVHLVQVDGRLGRDGGLLPGLGDAGDRIFGAPGSQAAIALGRHDKYQWEEAGDAKKRPLRKAPGSPGVVKKRRHKLDEPSTAVLGDMRGDAPPADIPDAMQCESLDETATQLTTHDGTFGPSPCHLAWGEKSSVARGPVLATTRHTFQRNAIGAHAGGYSIYRALAVASGGLDQAAMPKLGLTTPAAKIGPHLSWKNPKRIVTMDPWGHAISEGFGPWLNKGYDVRPTIAITKAHVELPECKEALRSGRLVPDGDILEESGTSVVTKAAIEPVWYLPGVAERFGVSERVLRDALFAETNSMYPELISRDDLKVFLPPIGGMTVYIWGDVEKIPDESVELTCRVHDECNGSDVFGSDICTCRPYLTHAIEECIKTAQRGGTGVVVYFRKEGRALGEVTKYLVYNMRKRQEGGDKAAEYFNCTQSVAGIQDTRFQALMPDVLHWLGITKIHNFISMSDMKYNAITSTGITIENRIEIPPEMVPKDAQVEIAAKVFHGYHAGKAYDGMDEQKLDTVVGRIYKPDKTAQRVDKAGKKKGK